MPTPRLSVAVIQTTLKAWAANGYSQRNTITQLKISRASLYQRMQHARNWAATKEGELWCNEHGIDINAQAPSTPLPPSKPHIVDNETHRLREQIKHLKAMVEQHQKDEVTAERIREGLLELTAHQPSAPPWLNDRRVGDYHHGIPALMLSDLHFGEKVYPEQIFNCNEYDSNIAEARVKRVVDKAILLTSSVLHEPRFPGMVLILAGDNINGLLHEELVLGSDNPIMGQVLHVADVLHATILKLVKHYGKIYVVGVGGNHGRNTRKPWAKFYAETNFDWIIYQMLERYLMPLVLQGKVVFLTPAARDVTFKIAGRPMRLTHGDQFRGGDGIIGPLGPITRGDKKKRSMAMSLPGTSEQYMTLLMGHFHWLHMTPYLIINGSTKGYDEYALSNNFAYEPPQQALFLTHEKYGINHYMPVLADEPADVKMPEWASHMPYKQMRGADELLKTMGWINDVP